MMKTLVCGIAVLLASLPATPVHAGATCHEVRFEEVRLPDGSFVDAGRHLTCVEADAQNARVAAAKYDTLHGHVLILVYGYTSSHSKASVSAAEVAHDSRTEACVFPAGAQAFCVRLEPDEVLP